MRYDPPDPPQDKAIPIKGAHKPGPGGGKHADNPARGQDAKELRASRARLRQQAKDDKEKKDKEKDKGR